MLQPLRILVSHFCKGTAFVFSRQIKESICILNGHCGRELCGGIQVVSGWCRFAGAASPHAPPPGRRARHRRQVVESGSEFSRRVP